MFTSVCHCDARRRRRRRCHLRLPVYACCVTLLSRSTRSAKLIQSRQIRDVQYQILCARTLT